MNMATMVECIKFINKAVKVLPIDTCPNNFPRLVKDACFSKASPTRVESPRLIAWSASALRLLDINITEENELEILAELAEYFSGNRILPGSAPHAHCYAGHQYGFFNGQLGDGANLYMGDLVNSMGHSVELHLKGTGTTPYSRAGTDGRKVLRSSVREFLCSEAMFHLGIPTVRAGTCIVSDTMVDRDRNYDGNPRKERAAVVSRIAPTLLRVGSLEIVKTEDPLSSNCGPSHGNIPLLKKLLDFVIETHYPEINDLKDQPGQCKYLLFFEELVKRTARMVALWQSICFCHGVINTDNISLLGLTLDYGPFSFMDIFSRNHTSNASDHWAKFTFKRQPTECKWCLSKLTEVLSLILNKEELEETLSNFDEIYEDEYLQVMKKKLGLKESSETDRTLIDALLDVMENTGADYHQVFRILSRFSSNAKDSCLLDITKICASVDLMKIVYQERQQPTKDEIVRSLWALQSNPKLADAAVLRSHTAIGEINTQSSRLRTFLAGTTQDMKKAKDRGQWSEWLQMYRKRLVLENDSEAERHIRMLAHNPKFVLKNRVLNYAISEAEKGNKNAVMAVKCFIENPFSETPAGNTHSALEDEIKKIHSIYKGHQSMEDVAPIS